jgi:hypothetical protein
VKGEAKVNKSLQRPEQALRFPGIWGTNISRQPAHESGKVVINMNRPSFPPRKYTWYSFMLSTQSLYCGLKDYVIRTNRDLPTCSAVPQTYSCTGTNGVWAFQIGPVKICASGQCLRSVIECFLGTGLHCISKFWDAIYTHHLQYPMSITVTLQDI